ncbi:TonB-dependent receptor plug domain-containing protein [Geofilum sp. OHC36d9]|uniref:TonB-dependent receptor plug domain-containing protein n=1 Tax=Geofilum sp. OHC36d9 TaxID=3458413 RepID=UPI00403423E3
MRKIILLLTLLFIFSTVRTYAQQAENNLSREELVNMSMEELSELPLEQLMGAMDVMGVSSINELYDLIMNKNMKSASKRSENAFDAPLSSSVLTKEEIFTFGATSIEEALRLIPGVIVREKTNGNFDIHIRGLDNIPQNNMLLYTENTNTLLMIDGRPVFNYAYGAIVWESLPIGFEDIERIEVVRGPASALYGPNAVNGVINIITSKTDDSSPLISGVVRGGTQETYTGDIAFRKKWNKKISTAITSNFQHRNRNTDKIYLFDNENGLQYENESGETIHTNGGFYTLDQYSRMKTVTATGVQTLIPVTQDVNDLFEDPELARENMGVNFYSEYTPNSDLSFTLSTGFQTSYVNSSPIIDLATSFTGRKSNTGYGNLQIQYHGLSTQINYMSGSQDFATGEVGFKGKMQQINASTEYNWQLKSLNLRPGISYQSAALDDTPYLSAGQKGYLNGKKELNTFSASLRAEYLFLGKLRLVSALRAEKYNLPDKIYPSWQIAGTMPLGENQILRAVYSRANRSSFLINSRSNYLWNRNERGLFPQYMHFDGNENYKLMKIDMIELGYRIKPSKTLMIDLEIFGSESRDYGALLPEYSKLSLAEGMDADYATAAGYIQSILAGGTLPDAYVNIKYQNLPVDARQIGLTASIDWIISPKLVGKFHGTIQQTKLNDVMDHTISEITEAQLNDAYPSFEQLAGGILYGEIAVPLEEQLANSAKSDFQFTDYKDNVEHKTTPAFWGMAGLTYKPVTKFTISGYGYYYSEQTFNNQYETATIDPKLILNMQATYSPGRQFSVFINARNLLNDESGEFPFMDEIGDIYMAGLRFKY